MPEGEISISRSHQIETLSRGSEKGDYPLVNVHRELASVAPGSRLDLNGIPHEVSFVAVQGFSNKGGVASFHREPTDPPVTEMYFPLVGRATAYVQDTEETDDIIGIREVTMLGPMTAEDLNDAQFELVPGRMSPRLRVYVGERVYRIRPAVLIPPGDLHSTLAALPEGHEQPRFFAIKLSMVPEK